MAAAASGSAPAFFDPTSHTNGYGIEEKLIDGAVICNNPSFYAYMISHIFNKKRNFRIISLGTGSGSYTIGPK